MLSVRCGYPPLLFDHGTTFLCVVKICENLPTTSLKLVLKNKKCSKVPILRWRSTQHRPYLTGSAQICVHINRWRQQHGCCSRLIGLGQHQCCSRQIGSRQHECCSRWKWVNTKEVLKCRKCKSEWAQVEMQTAGLLSTNMTKRRTNDDLCSCLTDNNHQSLSMLHPHPLNKV